MEVGVGHIEVAADHTLHWSGAEGPLVLRKRHIDDSMVILHSLLLTHCGARQEADIVACVVLEAYLFNRVIGCFVGQVRQFRILSAIGHSRNENSRRIERRKARVDMNRVVILVDADPVARFVPFVALRILRIPTQVIRNNGYRERNRSYFATSD